MSKKKDPSKAYSVSGTVVSGTWSGARWWIDDERTALLVRCCGLEAPHGASEGVVAHVAGTFDACPTKPPAAIRMYAETIDMSAADTSHVTSMEGMFGGLQNVRRICGLGRLDTSHVTSMHKAFYQCMRLMELDGAEAWDTSSVTDMEDVFRQCTHLESTGFARGWDTSRVTTLDGAFFECTRLRDVSGLAAWDTSAVTDMYCAFCTCKRLEDISQLSGWDTSNVTNFACMFQNTHVTTLDALAGWDVSKATDSCSLGYMFCQCTHLRDVSGIAGWDPAAKAISPGRVVNGSCKRVWTPGPTSMQEVMDCAFAGARIDEDDLRALTGWTNMTR